MIWLLTFRILLSSQIVFAYCQYVSLNALFLASHILISTEYYSSQATNQVTLIPSFRTLQQKSYL
jgi:uncharacterized protein YccT (UPF0319 family)